MPTSFSQAAYANTTYSGADIMATISIKNTDKHKNALYVLGELQTLSYSTHMNRSAVRKLGNVNAIDFTNGPRTIAGSLVFAVFNKHIIKPIIEQMQINQDILPDELPPFDITITYANEYGHNSAMRIYGVRLVNEGQVCSVNDVYTENTYQYVAQNIELLSDTELNRYASSTSQNDNTNTTIANNDNNKNPIISDLFDMDINNQKPQENPNNIISKLTAKRLDYNKTSFDVNPKQDDLQLRIDGIEIKNTYDINKEQWPFTLVLPVGDYVATLQKKNGQVFNSISVKIKSRPVNAPYVTEITPHSIKGKIPNTSVVTVFCRNGRGQKLKSDIRNGMFEFKGLDSDTEYYLYCQDNYNIAGEEIKVKTKKNIKTKQHEKFIEFAKNNNIDSPEMIDFIKQAEQVSEDLLEGAFEIYNRQNTLSSQEQVNYFMHLIAYFYVSINQSKNDFIYINKWLNIISSHPSARNFKIYSSKGMFKNIQDHQGIVKLQQNFNNTIQNIKTFQALPNYYLSLKKNYEIEKSNHLFLKERFNTRYNASHIHKDFGYYDEMLLSKGAYIEISGDKLIAHHNCADAFFVFKDDLTLKLSFKIKVPSSKCISYKELEFYNKQNHYLVYLEDQDKNSISKSVYIQNDKAYYNYSSLIKSCYYSNDLQFVYETLYRNSHAFDAFCDGIYLLINRRNDLKNFIDIFDKYFYTQKKDEYIIPHEEDGYLKFKENIQYLIFDAEGNLLEKGTSNSIKKQLNGYLVWSSSTYKASYLNFTII